MTVPLLGGLWNDDGVYLVLGRALASGHGYRALHLPGEPFHLKFPPGWPLVLSTFWAATGSLSAVLILARTWNVVALGLAARLLWRLACVHRRLPPLLVTAFAIMPLLLDATLELAAIPTSEPTFLLLWVLSLVLWDEASGPTGDGRSGWAASLCLGLAVAATALVRGPGVAVVGAALIALAVARWPRRARLVALCAMLAPVIVWAGYANWASAHLTVSDMPDDRSYLAYLAASIRKDGWLGAMEQVSDHATEMWRAASYHAADNRQLAAILVGPFLLAGLAGVVRLARRDPFLAASVAGMLLLVLVWPFPQFRLLLPIAPLLGVAAAAALAPLVRAPARRWGRVAVDGMVLCGMAAVAWRQLAVHDQGVRGAASGRGLPVLSPAYALRVNAAALSQVVPWIERHTRPDERLMVGLPSAVFLQSARQAVPSDLAGVGGAGLSSESYLLDRIRKDRLSWVILADAGVVGGAAVRAVARQCPGLLTPAESLGAVRIYAVDRANACAAPT